MASPLECIHSNLAEYVLKLAELEEEYKEKRGHILEAIVICISQANEEIKEARS